MRRKMSPIKERRDLAKRNVAVVGEREDGSIMEWPSIGLATLALGVGNVKLHEIVDGGKPYKHYVRITFKKEK